MPGYWNAHSDLDWLYGSRHSGFGPEDEPDDRVNGDPDSLTGEEDESGFDEMTDWPEPDFEPEDEGDDDE